MSPVKKRTRLMKAEEKVETPSSTSAMNIQKLFGTLLNEDNVDTMKNSLLKIKALQRQLYTKLQDQTRELEQSYKTQELKFRNQAASQYERIHLQAEIQKCKSYRMTVLEKVARDELDNNSDSGSMNEDGDSVISKYLEISALYNPQEKTNILATLHRHLEARGKLESTLNRKQQELIKLTQQLQVKQDFLSGIPSQLQTIERACQPLAKSFAQKSNTSSSELLKLSGKERLQRLETAHSLAPPLYTLFSLLQHYTDKICGGEDSEDVVAHSKLSLKVMATNQQQLVTLQLHVPEYTASTNQWNYSKRVSIQFRYYPEVLLVTAQATGCGSTLNQDILLDELFPQDTTVAAERLLTTKLQMNYPTASTQPSVTGTPYQWCNVLAGLFHAETGSDEQKQKEEHEQLVHSTRVVVQELMRRTRANATLKQILHSLKRNSIPSAPKMSTDSTNNSCKLSSFVLDKETDKTATIRIYQVAIKTTTAVTLNAQVKIHMSRYPAVPPVWTLDRAKEEEEPPLYDTRMAQLEHLVNVEVLENVDDNEGDVYFEWILVHQIRSMMHLLEQQNDNGGAAAATVGYRSVRGRDRKSVQE